MDATGRAMFPRPRAYCAVPPGYFTDPPTGKTITQASDAGNLVLGSIAAHNAALDDPLDSE